MAVLALALVAMFGWLRAIDWSDRQGYQCPRWFLVTLLALGVAINVWDAWFR
ncbi:hypothetical protein [Paraferrimonas sedimenticola]|uniref:hypothetical protein n=1 Tax=Paraferrimonas sedimenticola TaxID=375674 RepID=UPI0014743DB6|nr:hypothetical protein [Paraferrimonas sedimenticola]